MMENYNEIVDLVLIATTTSRRIERALFELGDTLYAKDPEISIVNDSVYPLLYVFSRRIDPWTAFKLAVSEPLSNLERIIPVETIASIHIRNADDLAVIADIVKKRIDLNNIKTSDIYVEVKPRRYYMMMNEKKVTKEVSRILTRTLSLKLTRRSRYVAKIEDTRYGVVVSLMRKGYDRLSLWRSFVLGLRRT